MPDNYKRAWREKQAAAGLCARCSTGKPKKGCISCSDCLDQQAAYNSKRRRRTREMRIREIRELPPPVYAPLELPIYAVSSMKRGAINPPERLEFEHEKWVQTLWRQREEAQRPFKPVRIERIIRNRSRA